jgi:para-aminobenzoate synthetase component I
MHALTELNHYGKNKIPFIFIIDFDKNTPVVIPLKEYSRTDVRFDLNGYTNCGLTEKAVNKEIIFRKFPVDPGIYKKKFDLVNKHLAAGDTYLINLTQPTKIVTNLALHEIFMMSSAKYKLLFRDEFIFFSPETFITIEGNTISTCPMKGTINADIPDAEKIILSDQKEFAEHITVVDLLRNDLGMVANEIKVEKFRYVEKIKTLTHDLLQISSLITGVIGDGWFERIGDIMDMILPAGSVTGAPKKRTVEIIKEAEGYERGYYTGVCGYYDGKKLDSCVMIRFIERIGDELYFKSGGGITIYSNADSEYKEMTDKVYVPAFRISENI